MEEDDWPVDALGNPVPYIYPNEQVYNGVLRAPQGAWGNQRAEAAKKYVATFGGPNEEWGFRPMQRGMYVGAPEGVRDQKEVNRGN